MNQQQQPLIPFHEGALFREAILFEGESITLGRKSKWELPKVGFLSYLTVHVQLVVSFAGTPTVHEDGLYRLIDAINLNVNLNNSNPIKLDGYHLKLANQLDNYGFSPDLGGVGKSSANSSLYSVPSASGSSQTVNFIFVVPIAQNTHRDKHIGVLPLMAQGFRANLEIQWAALADVFTGGTPTLVSSQVKSIEAGYYQTPDWDKVDRPSRFICKRISESKGITTYKGNKYEIPQEGQLFALAHVLRLNSTRSDKLSKTYLEINGDDVPIEQTLFRNRLVNRKYHGIATDTGVVLHNFLKPDNHVFSGNPKETYATGFLAQFDSKIEIESDASFGGSGTDTLSMLRVFMQPLAQIAGGE